MGWQKLEFPGKLSCFAVESAMQFVSEAMKVIGTTIHDKNHTKGMKCPVFATDELEATCDSHTGLWVPDLLEYGDFQRSDLNARVGMKLVKKASTLYVNCSEKARKYIENRICEMLRNYDLELRGEERPEMSPELEDLFTGLRNPPYLEVGDEVIYERTLNKMNRFTATELEHVNALIIRICGEMQTTVKVKMVSIKALAGRFGLKVPETMIQSLKEMEAAEAADFEFLGTDESSGSSGALPKSAPKKEEKKPTVKREFTFR